MQPILITLLFIPPIVLVVAFVALWWQLHVAPPQVTSFRASRISFWILLALAPGLLWLFVHQRQPDYLLWIVIGLQWVVGIARGIPALRAYRRRSVPKT
jgi:hypothetical protein